MLFGMSASCAIQSQDFIKGFGFTTAILLAGIISQAAELLRGSRQFFFPDRLIFQRLDNLRSDGILFFLWKSRHLT